MSRQQHRHDSMAKADYLVEELKEVPASAAGDSPPDKIQYDSLISGFNALCVAAGFVAAIQAQLMSLTIDKDDTLGIRAINALFMGGMLVDIMAAMMGYLTIRWLERMRDAEQTLLNKLLQLKTNGRKADSATGAKPVDFDSASINIGPPSLAHKFMALSLMIPLPFVMIGIAAMLAGIYVYVWTQHPTPVAIVVTVMGLSTLPFIACDFMIGRNEDRRKFIIRRLCELQGDW